MIHSELYFVGSMSNLFGEKRIQEDGRAKVIIFSLFLVVNCFREFPSYYQEFFCFGHPHNEHNRVKVIM